MNRRDALELVVIGSAVPAAGQEHSHAAAETPAKAPKFFTKAQYELVDQLSELVIPADAHSPGAREAKVAAFIDDLVSELPDAAKADWTKGLAAVEAEARKRFGTAFVSCAPAQQDQIMKDMAGGEEAPKNDLHRIFVRLKTQTLSGYYTSPVGLLKELQYKGNVALTAFPPCNHPDHHRPEAKK